MSKKKVLIIAESSMSLTGVPVVFMSIVRELCDIYSFDIVVLKKNDMHFESEFKSFGGNIYFLDYNKPHGAIRSFFWALFSFKKKVKRFIKKTIDLDSYACVHAFNGEVASILFKSKKHNKRIIKIFHVCSANSAYSEKQTMKEKVWNSLFSGSYRYADKIVFVSNAALNVNKWKKKGMVLYNVGDENKRDRIIECKHKHLRLTQIGTFSSRKNQLFSLSVLKLIKTTAIPNVILYIVGKELENGYLEKLQNYILKNDLTKNVVFCEPSIDKASLYSDTSYTLFPSTKESFGLVLIDCQSVGIHCFASNTIPDDADMGNVDFIPLVEQKWANEIVNYYKSNGNKRKQPENKDLFSKESFKQNLLKLYRFDD